MVKFILHLVYARVRNYSFIFWRMLFIFGMFVGHDARMCILYRFHSWLIFAGVMGFKMKIHSASSLRLCMQPLIYLIVDFIHIWYFSWARCEDMHIIQISRLVDFCRILWPLMMKIHSSSCLCLCTQLLIYPLADFVHIWYVGWA